MNAATTTRPASDQARPGIVDAATAEPCDGITASAVAALKTQADALEAQIVSPQDAIAERSARQTLPRE